MPLRPPSDARRIVPGGVAGDIDRDGTAPIRALHRGNPAALSRRWSSSTTTPRRCRTGPSTTGVLTRNWPGNMARAAMSAAPPAALSTLDARPAIRPMRTAFDVPVLKKATSMPVSGSASARSSRACPWSNRSCERLPDGPVRAKSGRTRPREGMALVEGFRGDILVWLGSATAGSSAATCVIRRGFNGRCSRRRSRETSSPTFRSATSRSIAPIRATICKARLHAQAALQSLIRPPLTEHPPAASDAADGRNSPARSDGAATGRLGRSLSIRAVDAGSCNGCELEIHALNNAFYDIERFGIRFVASPRHADVLLVTGPVTKNMREALKRTYRRNAQPQMGGRHR